MSVQVLEITVEERLQRAVAFKVEGRYEDAERELRAMLAEEPENPQVRREMGLVLGFTGMFDEAIEELRRAVELDGDYLEARNDLALHYAMLGMNDEALAEFETVLEVDPGNPVALRHIVYFR